MSQEHAILLTDGCLGDAHGKTAHGLIRGPSRYVIRGVVDRVHAGQDAGVVLDGNPRGLPVAATVEGLLSRLETKPDCCVVGVATAGGRLTPSLKQDLMAAARAGLSLVNGLHQPLVEVPELVRLAQEKGITLKDLRQPRPRAELAFWTGEVLSLSTPRIAVLGTDCALGKRTTCQLLRAAFLRRGVRAEMVYTGQTGWLQGADHGFVFDATPNDFVSGELERAILECARDKQPDVILLEGQSGLRNPSGPCGAELLLSGGASGVVLQHAPGRTFFSGLEECGCRLPSLASEVALIQAYGVEVWAVTLNEEGLAPDQRETTAARLSQELRMPVVLPLRGGADTLAELLQRRLSLRGTPHEN